MASRRVAAATATGQSFPIFPFLCINMRPLIIALLLSLLVGVALAGREDAFPGYKEEGVGGEAADCIDQLGTETCEDYKAARMCKTGREWRRRWRQRRRPPPARNQRVVHACLVSTQPALHTTLAAAGYVADACQRTCGLCGTDAT